jgi:hypothetical protein
MIKNQSGQSIGAQMINASTGGAFTGTVTVYITIDAGSQNIGSVGGGACVHEGNGYHTYLPSQDETNGDLIAFTFVGSNAIPQTIQVATVTAAQQSALSSATGELAISVLQLLTDALMEIGVVNAVDAPSAEDAALALRKLNELFDDWNAEYGMIYADTITAYTLTPDQNPHTIGPTGDFVVTSRPERIKSAYYLTSDGYRYPITVRDAAWYADVGDPERTAEIPTDLYLETAWPDGNLWLYPVPDTARQIELRVPVVIGQVVLGDTFWMPPGYKSAVTLTLAESLAAPFKVPLSPLTVRSAAKARARVYSKNVRIPRLQTQDSGMPCAGGDGYDYRRGPF